MIFSRADITTLQRDIECTIGDRDIKKAQVDSRINVCSLEVYILFVLTNYMYLCVLLNCVTYGIQALPRPVPAFLVTFNTCSSNLTLPRPFVGWSDHRILKRDRYPYPRIPN